MQKTKNVLVAIARYLAPSLLAIVLSLGVARIFAWSGPSAAPPDSNTPAPLNVGVTDQTKAGDICTLKTGTKICLSSVTGGGIVNSYSKVWSAVQSLTNTSWQNSGLSITVTPASASSEFYITANIVANNGTADGDCAVGLFRDSTALVAPFAQIDNAGGNHDADTWGISYVDSPGDTSSHTYAVATEGNCYLNQSVDTLYTANSTMTILETK